MQQSEKAVPEIPDIEEDAPYNNTLNGKYEYKISKLSKEKSLKSTDWMKLSFGSITLILCIILMFVCIIISVHVQDGELVKSGFEAFRLIIMTILGYIFGTNNTKSE